MKRVLGGLLARLDRAAGTRLRDGLSLGWQVAPHVASRPVARARVVLAAAAYGLGMRRPVEFTLDAPSGEVPFVVPDMAAMMVLRGLFIVGEYDITPAPPPRAIVDVGANVGLSALYFRRRFPGARILAVEPSPDLVPLLRRNTAALDVEVLHAAVAADRGTVRFTEADDSWAGITTGGAGVEVPAVTLDDLLEGIDFLKLDIEGAEFEALPASGLLTEVATIVGEIHAPPTSRRAQELLELLPDHEIQLVRPDDAGFTLFQARRVR